jgi:hypothetical protein
VKKARDTCRKARLLMAAEISFRIGSFTSSYSTISSSAGGSLLKRHTQMAAMLAASIV